MCIYILFSFSVLPVLQCCFLYSFFFFSVSFPLCNGMYSVNRSNGMNNLLSASTLLNNSVVFRLLLSVSLVLIYMCAHLYLNNSA